MSIVDLFLNRNKRKYGHYNKNKEDFRVCIIAKVKDR